MRLTFPFIRTLLSAFLLSLPLLNAQADGHGFIPADFQPPTLVETGDFIVKPLGPELMEIDYVAYMSSIEHLQKTFTRSTSWPHEGLDMDDALLDMQTEERRFNQRESFAYAVLTPDGKTELGCVYVYPSKKAGFDAVRGAAYFTRIPDAGNRFFGTHPRNADRIAGVKAAVAEL